MGSIICWGITRDAESVKRLKGMLIMSGVTDPDFAKSAFYKSKLPLWFAHGSRDPVIPIALGERMFALAHEPKQFVRFEGGGHEDLDNYGALEAAHRFIDTPGG